MKRLVCALALCAIGAACAADTKVTLRETSKAGSAAKSFVATTVIDAPVPTLCALIQDYADYPSFMPNTQSVKVSPQPGGQALIDVTLKLPMGKIKKYRLRMQPTSAADSCTIAWKLVPWPGLKQEETIADTTGQWQLLAAGAGKSAVTYTVSTDPGPVPFGLGWIVDSLSKDSIPQTLDGLRKRAATKP